MKKIKIAFCDSNADILPIIAETTKTAFSMRGIVAETRIFTDPAAFLGSAKTDAYDIVMLDVEIAGVDGISIGKQLSQLDNQPMIIFVSNNENKVFETYVVHPFSFVRKNMFLKDITETVGMYTEYVEKVKEKTVVVQTRENKVSVKLANIVYIEGSKNYQKLFLKSGSTPILELRSTMEKIESELEGLGFARIHKGYMVNLSFVCNVTRENVTLTTGIILPVSTRKATETTDEYIAYCKNKGSLMI